MSSRVAESVAGSAGLDATTPWVRRWLRTEGLAALLGAAAGWGALGGDPVWFLLLLIVPDVSMLGYLGGPHAGAIAYNVIHNWATAALVVGAGLVVQAPALTFAGMILVGHVGADRLFGYGLKYPTGFRDTHLGRIGRTR